MYIILLVIASVALILATITDIKKREVPDWLNFSLIPAGIGLRLIWSVADWNFTPFLEGLAGFGLFLVIAYFMYYAGQWGGGDSKMLMGLGALIGLEFRWLPFLLVFIVNVLLIGAVYGLIYSFVLAFIHKKKFLKEYKKILGKKRMLLRMLSVLALIVLVSFLFISDLAVRISLILLILLLYFSFFLWYFVRAMEKTAMLKYVMPDKLVEGDWIAKDVKVGKEYICGPRDLGIDKKQIKRLISLYKKGKLKKVLVKEGIPFVPSFLAAFFISLAYGGWFLAFF